MMSETPCLNAVVELLWSQVHLEVPWQIADYEPSSFMSLHGDMTSCEVGLIIGQLVNYKRLKEKGNVNDVLHQIIESESMGLPGGLQAINSAGKVISPGCCCDLDSWRDWLDFLQTGQSPWLGHSPGAWIETVGGLIRVCSGGGMYPEQDSFHIDFERTAFEKQLEKVQQDLSDFVLLVELWAAGVGFPQSWELAKKFDQFFYISAAPTPLLNTMGKLY
ncbi:MAG: hypothetical protein KME29_13245 [Calothrix sp. FI2-JRJ7]|jgi:hypothetical protein|nr:hypothetical protein [Calothrix sp. FI2-JRJ7]